MLINGAYRKVGCWTPLVDTGECCLRCGQYLPILLAMGGSAAEVPTRPDVLLPGPTRTRASDQERGAGLAARRLDVAWLGGFPGEPGPRRTSRSRARQRARAPEGADPGVSRDAG